VVGREARIRSGFKVAPARVKGRGWSLDDELDVADRSQRSRFAARGDLDARVEVGTRCIEDHEQIAVLILHHRAKESRAVAGEEQVAALGEVRKQKSWAMCHLDLPPQDARNYVREDGSAIADGCVKREGDHRLSSTDAVDGRAGDARVDGLDTLQASRLIRIGRYGVAGVVGARSDKCAVQERRTAGIKIPHDGARAGGEEAVVAETVTLLDALMERLAFFAKTAPEAKMLTNAASARIPEIAILRFLLFIDVSCTIR
jgi:hypothetical protein